MIFIFMIQFYNDREWFQSKEWSEEIRVQIDEVLSWITTTGIINIFGKKIEDFTSLGYLLQDCPINLSSEPVLFFFLLPPL